MTLKIDGLDRLNRKFAALPRQVRVRIREAMEQGAEEIARMAKSLAPEDSGALVASIGWTWGSAPKGSITLASVKSRSGDGTITIYAGNSDAFYARWVEFGTSAHKAGGKFKGAEIPAIPAQPFFFVSYRVNRKRVKGRVTRAINKAARDVAAGG